MGPLVPMSSEEGTLGIAGLFHAYTVECIVQPNGQEAKAEAAAPFVVLQQLLRAGKGQEELHLVNCMIRNGMIINLNKATETFKFDDNELCFYSRIAEGKYNRITLAKFMTNMSEELVSCINECAEEFMTTLRNIGVQR